MHLKSTAKKAPSVQRRGLRLFTINRSNCNTHEKTDVKVAVGGGVEPPRSS